jgi:Raf kinase inhibitor-like YbhB/YbcL family protein
MDRHQAISSKLVFSSLCALCAGAIAMAANQFTVDSSGFNPGGSIPDTFTCDGADKLPPLHVAGLPKGTAALAILVDDPDAPSGLFTHLISWNVPVDSAGAISIEGQLPEGTVVGTNDFGTSGWRGPCPPRGKPHHYRFHVFALKSKLALAAGANRAAFDKALAGNTLAEAKLVGTYKRGG